MKQFFKNKNNLIIGLFAVVILMGIGFAAYSQRLTITDTASSDSNWNVYIKSVTPGTKVGGASGSGEVEGKLTANLTTELKYPGDSITYTIVVANAGNIDAMLEEITLNQSNNDSVVKYSYAGIVKNDSLLKGEEKSFTVKVEYDSTKTGTATEAQKTNELTLNLDYVQKTSGGTVVEPTPVTLSTVYDYFLANDDYSNLKRIGATKINASEYVTDYKELDSYKAGKTWFLKYDIDREGIIQNAYACQKYSFIDEPVCMQGDTEGAYYSANKAILEGLKPTFESNSVSCSLGDSRSECGVGDFYVQANSRGEAYAGASSSRASCYVYSNSAVFCSE